MPDSIIEQPPLVVTKTQPPITFYLRCDFFSLTMLTMAATTLTNNTGRGKKKTKNKWQNLRKIFRNILGMWTRIDSYKCEILFVAMNNDDPLQNEIHHRRHRIRIANQNCYCTTQRLWQSVESYDSLIIWLHVSFEHLLWQATTATVAA